MFQPVKIAPSILSADFFMNLQRDIEAIQAGGAGYVHVDVMDGHFVPNLTMGVPVVKQLKKITDMPLDVHLAISNPLEQLPWFLEAGADIVTVHAEAAAGYQLERAVEMIHAAGAKAAASVKPHTPRRGASPRSWRSSTWCSSCPSSRASPAKATSRAPSARLRARSSSPAGGRRAAHRGRWRHRRENRPARGSRRRRCARVCGSAVCGADDPAAAIAQVTQAAEAARAAALASKEA